MFNRRDATRRVARPVRLGLAFTLAAPIVCWAQATNLDIAPQAPEAPLSGLIRQLLEEDAKRALDQERRQAMTQAVQSTSVTAPTAIAAPASLPSSTPGPGRGRLIAIAGVGSRLLVKVQNDGRQAAYLSGLASPVSGSDLGLRLQEISPPCATFLDQAQESVRYCINERSP